MSHQSDASCCTTGSLKAAAYHNAKCWAAGSLYPSCTMGGPNLALPLALISLHQWGRGLLHWDISPDIHHLGYFTGSGLSLSALVQD